MAKEVCGAGSDYQFQELQQRLAGLPGVKDVAAVFNLPMAGENWSQAFYLEGRPEPPPAEMPSANMRIVTPGYFRTMEIPVLRGRDFDKHGPSQHSARGHH